MHCLFADSGFSRIARSLEKNGLELTDSFISPDEGEIYYFSNGITVVRQYDALGDTENSDFWFMFGPYGQSVTDITQPEANETLTQQYYRLIKSLHDTPEEDLIRDYPSDEDEAQFERATNLLRSEKDTFKRIKKEVLMNSGISNAGLARIATFLCEAQAAQDLAITQEEQGVDQGQGKVAVTRSVLGGEGFLGLHYFSNNLVSVLLSTHNGYWFNTETGAEATTEELNTALDAGFPENINWESPNEEDLKWVDLAQEIEGQSGQQMQDQNTDTYGVPSGARM